MTADFPEAAAALRAEIAAIRTEIRTIKAMIAAIGAGVYGLMLLEIIARTCP